ncbi:hypothetical protein BH11BAC5_BH11BAC5_09130 [soil metagenome]
MPPFLLLPVERLEAFPMVNISTVYPDANNFTHRLWKLIPTE